MSLVTKYSSFIKLEHTLFSLPMIFSGAFIAENQWPSLRVTLLILLAGTSARIVAMTLNRIIDREIDKKNPRTAGRHLPSGSMKLYEAWLVVFLALGLYLLAAWLLNDVCLSLAWVPLVGFCAYPFFKRFTKWTHLGLGLVWSFVPVAGYLAVKPEWDGIGPALALGVFSIFWLAGFDIIYATMDEEFDRQAGVHSLPAAWGSKRALRFSAVMHALAFITLVVLYAVWFAGPITVMLLALTGVLLFMEQWFTGYVDMAFFQINAVIGFVIFFFVLSGLKGV
jgi:4-hydroxybenzoate polyprenyltransferase